MRTLDSILKLLIAGGLIYLIYFFVSKGGFTKIDKEAYRQIDSLNQSIKVLESKQFVLINEIETLNSQLDSADDRISKIKKQKVIIKEKYYEKIKTVDNFTDNELDSFFSTRYPDSY